MSNPGRIDDVIDLLRKAHASPKTAGALIAQPLAAFEKGGLKPPVSTSDALKGFQKTQAHSDLKSHADGKISASGIIVSRCTACGAIIGMVAAGLAAIIVTEATPIVASNAIVEWLAAMLGSTASAIAKLLNKVNAGSVAAFMSAVPLVICTALKMCP